MAAETQPLATQPAASTQIAVPAGQVHTPRILHVNHFFDGVILALAMIAALLFIRLYRKTSDRFYLFFSAAFFIYGFNRILHQFYTSHSDESKVWLYSIRLVVFALIIIGCADKNRRRSAAIAAEAASRK